MTHEVILLHIIIAAEIVPRAQQTLDADMVILSAGVKPNDDLYNALRAAGHPSVWKTGDGEHQRQDSQGRAERQQVRRRIELNPRRGGF